jgi:hypothetical protein
VNVRERPTAPPLDEAEVTVALDGPLSIRSGRATTRELLVGNRTAARLEFVMGPVLVADVVDPRTGEIVGGHSGLMDAVRGGFSVAPGGTTRVPLLVATDSFEPSLGYAVPPGEWGIQVTLTAEHEPGSVSLSRTPVLPLTVTA